MELLTITKTDLTSLLLKAILEQYFILDETIIIQSLTASQAANASCSQLEPSALARRSRSIFSMQYFQHWFQHDMHLRSCDR